ncbi:xaa-Pro aminopeptidase-like protein [Cucurbitaria berberidis CBS 394.84]|uniref:Xaa-Pro aminopeptidase n=1 Tax=Cucurbitaria berberidis CBS 394.84 TaxID=1168544 RepID=A0A9P4GH22_9PLEO|nr:xaa-Pro aminopeptidase-like protein [Cucurbitaria berberidis CBS 394.84]KAF1845096.1 xaa-Pro aminopeptidase-like protein [Cucurbitaria berberidis CBS 394.84]
MSSCIRLSRPVTRIRWRVADRHCWRGYASVPAAELRFGQPLHETHPHLLKAGEVTPSITALEYYQRRSKLAKDLPPNSIAVLAASDLKYASGAVFYKFHQDPDFLYLTGFKEPDALAIIEKLDDEEHAFHLYVRPKDPKVEAWEGPRSGVEAAEDVFNADITGSIEDIPKLLPEIVNRSKNVYTDLPQSRMTKNILSRYLAGTEPVRTGGIANVFRDSQASIKPLRPLLNELRVIKSDAEVANMRRAGQHSGRAITDAMRQSFTNEKDLDSFLDYWFKQDGCDGPAYVPVVAGGINANTIHYVSNDMQLKPNDLVLVDAGALYGDYVTDITRTWPVSGKFTPAQKDLYNLLLSVQRTCISLCRTSSNFSLDKLHQTASKSLSAGLTDLGFDMSHDAIYKLFPHHVGHYVGLDVHDSPGLSRSRLLEKGMCVTVEPGIYVPDDERWPSWARGIGIRIEDSVCVDEESPYVLTTEAVKEIVDIEALRGSETKL